VVCHNPLVGAERARRREELLAATERDLQAIAARVQAGTLSGAEQIALEVGPALRRHRVRKHFEIKITDDSFTFARKQREIQTEAALDGFYVLRTSVCANRLPAPEVVRSYKQLKEAEKAFRTIKGPILEVRPIGHRLPERVKAHVFLCMLAYYLTWHLKRAWAELLFLDEQPPHQPDPVAKATRSASAERKAQSRRTACGQPVHSLRTLLKELSTQTRNTIRLGSSGATIKQLTAPTELQARAQELIERYPAIK
jgi:hypothetical protein